MQDSTLINKYDILKASLKSKRRLAVALSGGIDSTFLLFAAKECLPVDSIIAVTADGSVFPSREVEAAKSIANSFGIRHMLFHFDPLEIEGFSDNTSERCYLCKKHLYRSMITAVREEGDFVLCEGTNVDDEKLDHPGIKALDERGVFSPFREYGFTKAEIIKLANILDIPGADKPSCACLATRVPYGENLGEKLLGIIDEAENFIISKGFKQVRVRAHGTIFARIELGSSEISRFVAADVRFDVYEKLKSLGFAYVTLDVLGYRQGSFDEYIKARRLKG